MSGHHAFPDPARSASARRLAHGAALALALTLGTIGPALSQSAPPTIANAADAADDDWAKAVTVLTIAPDGTWGAATDLFINRAISLAIKNCKLKYDGEIGCGYRSTTVRAGWSLGFRCGDRNIIVADKDLAVARRSAVREEAELRTRYVPDLPPCQQVVAIDPDGLVMPTVAESTSRPANSSSPRRAQ